MHVSLVDNNLQKKLASTSSLVDLAVAQFGNGSQADAKATLIRHLADCPEDVAALALLAQVQEKLKQPNEAIVTLETAVRLAPTFAQGWRLLATLHSQRQNSVGAIDALFRYLKLKPDDAYAFGLLIHLLWQTGRVEEAAAMLGRAAKRNALPELKAKIAASLKQRRYSEAEQQCREALVIDDYDAELWCQLGSALTHLKRYPAAEDAYSRALAFQPNLLPALRTKAALCAQRKDLQSAGQLLQHAIKVAPDDADLLAQFGADVLAPTKLYAQAEAHFKRATELRPTFTQAWLNLSQIAIEQGHLAEATPYAEQAKQTLTDQTPLAFCKALAVVFARCNRIDDAKALFNICLRRDPGDALGVRLLLAQYDDGLLPDRAPDALLEEFYDARAQYWGTSSQCYHGAALVADELEHHAADRTGLTILDAGCGNGLVGQRVRHRAGRLVGIDLSQAMLEKVPPGLYDELLQGDLVRHMLGNQSAYDAITCAATLIHFGDLRPAFQAAWGSLRDNGLFILTLFPREADDKAGFGPAPMELASSGCYAHSEPYIRHVAEEAGFQVASLKRAVHEVSRVTEQMGLVVSLRRPSGLLDGGHSISKTI